MKHHIITTGVAFSLFTTACSSLPSNIAAGVAAKQPHAYYEAGQYEENKEPPSFFKVIALLPVATLYTAGTILTLGTVKFHSPACFDDGCKQYNAAQYYEKGAKLGDADCQFALGYAYANGRGVQKSYCDAVSWYQKAVDQGHSAAANNLGHMYLRGLCVPEDHETANRLFAQAAKAGNQTAQRNLVVRQKEFSNEEKVQDAWAFQVAIAANDVGKVRSLIERGSDVNYGKVSGGMLGTTPTTEYISQAPPEPLPYAVSLGRTEIARLLLDAGAFPDKIDNRGATPLEYAASQGHTEIVRMLLQRGASANGSRSRNHWGALQYAAMHGDCVCIQLLIDAGADPNRMPFGQTPYQIAKEYNRVAACQTLLRLGALP